MTEEITETLTTRETLDLKQKHITTWRNKPEWFWFMSLFEEVAELGLSLVGLHVGPTDWELKQIAAICLNWLEYRRNLAEVKRCPVVQAQAAGWSAEEAVGRSGLEEAK